MQLHTMETLQRREQLPRVHILQAEFHIRLRQMVLAKTVTTLRAGKMLPEIHLPLALATAQPLT